MEALWVQATVATRQEEWEPVESSLEEGLGLTLSISYPYGEARLLQVYAEMHAAKGEPKSARERIEAALANFRQLGAQKDAERVALLRHAVLRVSVKLTPVVATRCRGAPRNRLHCATKTYGAMSRPSFSRKDGCETGALDSTK